MITVLPKHVSDKIAAGEVVERPVSIVKELVENSIDAGSTRIVVEIRNGGKTYLRVTDNGCGIPSDQAALAFKRHATSKIQEAEDLDHIYTLGFRGEALASIAAVSKTEIVTKTADEKTGTRMLLEGGEVVEQSGTGCPEGTTIVVRDLFFNTPARLKFMKSDGAESGLIVEFVSQMALAYPSVSFRMINNEQTLFTTRGDGDRLRGIYTLYGRINGGTLLSVDSEKESYRLEGYVSDPGAHRSNRKAQIYFVNGRVINNKPMERSLDKAYAQRLFDGRHPIAYLFLEVPAEDLDVNIHPNKREVRFHRENEIEEFIRGSIVEVLQQKEAIPNIVISKKSFVSKDNTSDSEQQASNHKQVDIKSLLSDLRNRQQENTIEEVSEPVLYQPESKLTVSADMSEKQVASGNRFQPESLTPMGIVFGTYIVATDEDSLYLIDQHAAHERILYEQILRQMSQREKVTQTLLIPFTIRCSIAESAQNQWQEALFDMGFIVEPFGPSTFVTKEIPGFMAYEEAERFLSDFLDHISADTAFSDPKLIEKAASGACKAAIKGNHHLAGEEIDQLLIRLSQCDNPMSCPHGRPTFTRFPKGEIERKFRRI